MVMLSDPSSSATSTAEQSPASPKSPTKPPEHSRSPATSEVSSSTSTGASDTKGSPVASPSDVSESKSSPGERSQPDRFNFYATCLDFVTFDTKKKHGSLEGELIGSYRQMDHRKYLSIGILDISDTNRMADIGGLKVDIISLEISNSSSILPTYLEANVCSS